jgi:hypothetical protein
VISSKGIINMKRFAAIAAALLLALVTQLLAASPNDDKAKQEKLAYTQEMEKLKRTKPAEYDRMRTMFTFSTEMLLARLGYGIGPMQGVLDENFQSALKKYESHRGIPVTGDPLSWETMKKIHADTKLLDSVPVALPPLHLTFDFWDQGLVTGLGTWTIVGSQHAYAEQTTEFTCSRETGKCIMATAKVIGKGSAPQITANLDQYEIERWDEHEIVTKPSQAICNRLVYRINRNQKSVTGIRSTISNKGICEGVANAELHLALVDGTKLWTNWNQEYRRNWERLMQISPAVLQILKRTR